MKAVQVQESEGKVIEAKLDKIAYLLQELIQIHKEEIYPSEDSIRPSVIKRLESKVEEIASGRRKTRSFRSIQDLDRIISSN